MSSGTGTATSKYWSDLVKQLDPYVPGEQPQIAGLVKLNTNENPYPASIKVAEAVSRQAVEQLNLYPDPDNASLKQAVASYYQLSESHVLLGNGSDEVLAFAFQAFFKQSRPLLFPDITYGFYPVYCKLFGIDYQEVPLAEDFSILPSGYIEAGPLGSGQNNGGIIFPNPNAPTGLALGLESIKMILQANTESVVIIDEAYVDFGCDSAVSLIDRYPNLLVIQTLSKSRSMAGIRVGFALGNKDLIAGMERIKNSFNPYSVDRLAELAATAAIKDVEYFNDCRQKIIATRNWVCDQLQELGFDILPSKTNFIMAKPSTMTAAEMFSQLRERKVLVRYFNKPRIKDYIRISIGTDQEMKILITALKAILA